jgi:hypothetical protein
MLTAARAIRDYMKRHPEELARGIRGLAGLRLGVPLDAFRWLGQQAERSGKAQDVRVEAVPPGVRMSAILDLMRTEVRASAIIYVERIVVNGEQMRIELRLEDVDLKLYKDSDSPVALLIKSGALDLSKPGNLVRHLPHKPAFLLEARDNRIVLDMMRHPKVGDSPLARSTVSLVTSFLTIHGIETDERHLDVSLRALPDGVFHAAREVRRRLVAPSIRRARWLLPGGR